MSIAPVIAVEKSQNAKIGTASATYATQSTCPDTCPLMSNGCYAEKSFAGITTRRLNGTGETRLDLLAQLEADAIDSLSGKLDLRVHVVGDCKTDKSAKLVSMAMLRHTAKFAKRAWTYTHAWREVLATSWNGVNVLASCDTLKDVNTAAELGWATALVARKGTALFESLKQLKRSTTMIDLDGIKRTLIPCPNQVSDKKPSCIECGLCMRAEFLKATNSTIVFLEH